MLHWFASSHAMQPNSFSAFAALKVLCHCKFTSIYFQQINVWLALITPGTLITSIPPPTIKVPQLSHVQNCNAAKI
jgi:hypothetical protein